MAADPNLGASYLRGLPIGRMGAPEDINGLAVFLASGASSWITGALIPQDGGNLTKNAGGSNPGLPDATEEGWSHPSDLNRRPAHYE